MTARCLRILLLPALFVSLSIGCAQPPAPALTVVHFNDVYEIGPVEGGRIGGLARVATVINSLRTSHAPVITTLGGDYLSPSALATARIDGVPIAGQQMVDVLNAVGLDYATLGNHEFDLAEPAFHARLAESKFKIIASNVTDVKGALFPNTVPFVVVPVTIGGRALKIGLIGVMINSNPRPWVQYHPPVAAAKAAIAQMGPVDAVIALTHLSLGGDQELVSAVPEITVSLGGHEHENWLAYRGPDLTPIVKADANVRSLAVLTLTFPAGRPPVVAIRLEPITEAIATDATVDARVSHWTEQAFNAFRKDGFEPTERVADLTEALDGRESTVRERPGNMTTLIAEAMAREVGDADVALMNGGSVRIDDEIPVGPMTSYDVIRMLPFGGNIVRVRMAGSLLIRVLDVGEANIRTGGFLHPVGVEKRGGRWTIDGKPLNPALPYTVATTDFLISGREVNLEFFTDKHPLVREVTTLKDMRFAVIKELQRRFPLKSPQ
jgi:5'-nucleotidase/UDP-sugar diphosphatase